MARLPVRRRFWKTIINPRRRPRVEDGFREDAQYEIRISQRRREALYEDMPLLPESGRRMFRDNVPTRRRMRVTFRSFSHWPANPMGWVLNVRDLSGQVFLIPLRIIRKIFYLDA